MTVVGVDLSLTSTGWAVIGPAGDVEVGRVRSSGGKGATLADRWRRQVAILDELIASAGPEVPRLVVVEGPSYGSRGGSAHDRSGLWWAMVAALFEQSIPVVEVPPTVRAKYATGKGNAGKDPVLAAVVRRYPWVEVDGNDSADALVLAAMGARRLGVPIEEALPQGHLAAMGSVRWPEVAAS